MHSYVTKSEIVMTEVVGAADAFLSARAQRRKKFVNEKVEQSSSIFNHTIKDREWSEDARSWLRIIAS